MTDRVRQTAFGQGYHPTWVDRFGVWLSARRIRATLPSLSGLRLGDIGCGYNATFARSVLGEVKSAVLVDVALAPDLKAHDRVTGLEGALPAVLETLPEASLDLILCMSVLEHLFDPLGALLQFRRLCRPGAIVMINVPSWRGKWFLELSAFRLGLSPAEEMDDHKMYYDPRDIWQLLVKSGFRPSKIRVFRHKFGLNTFAVCRT